MWQHFKRTVNGTSTEIYAITWHVDDLKVGSLGSSSLYNSSLQGVNGTFYSGSQIVGDCNSKWAGCSYTSRLSK